MSLVNTSLLKAAECHPAKFIDLHLDSSISYGSKLHPVSQLDLQLVHHPIYNRFQAKILEGIDYLLNLITEDVCRDMLVKLIKCGNKKSALDDNQCPHVTKLMTQDVERRYGIPISVECLKDILGAEVYPIGC